MKGLLLLAETAIPLGGGRRLVLTGGSLGWFWLLLGAAALALLLLLYRYERALVSRRLGLTLLALRTLAALSLIFALFEPIAVRSFREQVRGRVVLGIDLSESMSTADPGRTAQEQQALRTELGVPAETDVRTLQRREVVRRLLTGPWLKGLQAQADVDVVGFARQPLTGVSVEALAARLAEPVAGSDPAFQSTDWQPVLEQTLRDEGSEAAPMLGLVMLTDGRQTAVETPERAATVNRLAARGVPVWSVAVGSTIPPADSAIASVRLPERVAKGDVVDVEVTVKLDGQPAGTEVPVILERPGKDPLRQTVRALADGARPRARFRVPLDQTGLQPLTLAVEPAADDIRPDNNRRTVAIDVTDDTTKVLLIDGTPRWEFQYIRNALARDPQVSLDAVVFRQPPSPEGSVPTYATSLPESVTDGPDPLNGYDAIILGDITPADWPAEAWERLERFVDQRGGTLLVSAGPASFPLSWRNETAKKLLPVQDPIVVPVDPEVRDAARPSLPAGVRVRPVVETQESWPMLRFAAEADRSRAVWENLPALPWVLAGRPKPAATPLIRAEGAGVNPEASATVVAMPYGLGQVLLVGTDGTWRWRLRAGDVYHHRFWGQALRWAAQGKLTAGNSVARFGPVRSRVNEGQSLMLRARFSEEATGVGPGLLVAARIYRASVAAAEGAESARAVPDGEPVAVVPLRPALLQPRVFEAAAPPLPAGFYVVKLEAPQVEGAPTDLAPFEIINGGSLELVELAAAREPLESLAQATSGVVFSDFEASQLLPRIQAQNKPRTRVESSSLWDRPITLALFFALLAGEWILRKRAGLP